MELDWGHADTDMVVKLQSRRFTGIRPGALLTAINAAR